MTEYNICKAIQEGYARERILIGGKAIICDAPECPEKYKIEIHIDGEPANICLVDGKIIEKGIEKKILAQNLQEVQDTSRISINLK